MDDGEIEFVRRLRALLELLPPALDRAVADLGITSYAFALLDAVDAAPGGRLRLSTLARTTHATLPRLSRVAKALEQNGLLERVPSRQDGRVVEARLTPSGRDTLSSARATMDDALQRLVIAPVRPADRRATSSALASILGALDPHGDLSVLSPTARGGADSERPGRA